MNVTVKEFQPRPVVENKCEHPNMERKIVNDRIEYAKCLDCGFSQGS
jgi:hypothetical protein